MCQACRRRFFFLLTCLFEKCNVLVFLTFLVNSWSIFVNVCPISVNVRYCVRTYLLYGTAYCTVLRTYLPTKKGSIARAQEGIKCYPRLVNEICREHKNRDNPENKNSFFVLPSCFTFHQQPKMITRSIRTFW